MKPPIAVFLAFRFLVELALLAALGAWAWRQSVVPVMQLMLATIIVVAAALVWGVFVSPKARVKLSEGGRLTVELLIVLAAVLALRDLREAQLALALGVIAVVTAVVNSMLRRATGRPIESELIR